MMFDIEDFEDEFKCLLYNQLLNKYKLYNNVFGVNYFIYENNNVSENFSDENHNGIFIWRDYNEFNTNNEKKCIFYHYIIKNFISILTKNFYKLFIDGGIVDIDEIRDYIRSMAKLYIKNIPLKHSKKLFNFFKKNVDNDIKFCGNYYYDLENILCFIVDSYIMVHPDEDNDNINYESFKIQNRLYNNLINKDGIYRG